MGYEQIRQEQNTAAHRRDFSTSVPKQRSTIQPSLLQHYRDIGNQAVQRMFETKAIQAKLTIGQPNDIYEQEADRVADQVMRMPETKLPKVCPSDGGFPKCAVEPGKERGKTVQAKVNAEKTSEPTPEFQSRINTLNGRPLPESEQTFFEPKFGMEFSKIRIHTDSNAAQMAASIQAKAFTVGNDIGFGQGEYLPGTDSGRRLLAHELTHTVQQAAVEETYGAPTIRRQCSANDTRRSNDLAEEARFASLAWDRSAVYASKRNFYPTLKVSRTNTKMIQREQACSRMAIPYEIVRGDTATKIARRYNTTVACLRDRNSGVDLDRIRPGQSINVPVSTCSVPVPTGQDKQILAGAIFGEAEQSRMTNDEREAIASTFQNRVFHVQRWADPSFCPNITGDSRSSQEAQDVGDFGRTLLQSISKGSLAYGGGQWNKVMDSDIMRSSADICTRIQPGELAPLHRAIQAANAMYGNRGRRFLVAFNRAQNQPPSPRMKLEVSIAAHSFYRFKQDRECG